MPSQISESGNEADLELLFTSTMLSDYRTKFKHFKGCFLPDLYEQFADSIKNMEVRDDDLWLCSFPQIGTAWAQEMIWCIGNNLNFEAAQILLNCRFPYLEKSAIWDYEKMDEVFDIPTIDSVKQIKDLASPRYIRTHLPYCLLPKQLRSGKKRPKIIYVTQNPKDACINYYRESLIFDQFKGNLNDFCRLYLGDKVGYAPFWDHIFGFWNKKDQNNVLFLKYEEMKDDLSSVIRKTADFLGKNLGDDEIKKLENHLDYDNMRYKPAIHQEHAIDFCKTKLIYPAKIGKYTINKDETLEWIESMSAEMISEFDRKTEEKLSTTDFRF